MVLIGNAFFLSRIHHDFGQFFMTILFFLVLLFGHHEFAM